ncbi:SprT family protein [Vagococcus sp. BWB3-3]|uniref:SprT family protein n=1 Tax=Vagococcus allomyrinae TaxID=2794353 RepID=A0A940P5W9_9ENTE|nr:SprT family protein [Vagococcus allomyrinae]
MEEIDDIVELTDDRLQELVELISTNEFDREFKHQAFLNSRLRTTGGRYHLNSHNLDFNPKVYERYGMEELVNVIKHELCHYHLHLEGRGFQHRDADFKNLLKKTGGSRFVKPLEEQKPENYQQYECLKCHNLILRKRRINIRKYSCRCGGQLKHL